MTIPLEMLYFMAGLALGALITLLCARLFYFRRIEASEAEKQAMFDEMRDRMADTFSALSTRALRDNHQAFFDLAKTTFSRYFDSAKIDMESRTKAMREYVQPLVETLDKFDEQVRSMERAREKAYGGLSEQVVSLLRTQQDLQRETGKLVQALRLPQVRGRWGELTLRRVVEIAGMQNHCDFYEQSSTQSEAGLQRPDMIVRLPGDRQIVIDAKVPLKAYLDALEADSSGQAQELADRHAAQVASHISRLAQKSYWRQFEPTPEFVVLFMPGENFFSSALSTNPGLIEDGAARGVILATPTTLITLLKTVAYAWRQESAVENAREVSRLGSELYSRIYAMARHFNRLGRELDKCVSTYNRTVGSLERRVLVSARKFQEMGVVQEDRKNLDPPEAVENKPRQMGEDNADDIADETKEA